MEVWYVCGCERQSVSVDECGWKFGMCVGVKGRVCEEQCQHECECECEYDRYSECTHTFRAQHG